MTIPQTIADTYLATWNAPNGVEAVIRMNGWAEDASYVDPLMQGRGRENIAAMIVAARSHFPGHSFTLAAGPDGHGSYVRFSWTLTPESGRPVAQGTDVVRLDESGRIAEVIGFLDGGAA